MSHPERVSSGSGDSFSRTFFIPDGDKRSAMTLNYDPQHQRVVRLRNGQRHSIPNGHFTSRASFRGVELRTTLMVESFRFLFFRIESTTSALKSEVPDGTSYHTKIRRRTRYLASTTPLFQPTQLENFTITGETLERISPNHKKWTPHGQFHTEPDFQTNVFVGGCATHGHPALR